MVIHRSLYRLWLCFPQGHRMVCQITCPKPVKQQVRFEHVVIEAFDILLFVYSQNKHLPSLCNNGIRHFSDIEFGLAMYNRKERLTNFIVVESFYLADSLGENISKYNRFFRTYHNLKQGNLLYQRVIPNQIRVNEIVKIIDISWSCLS